MNRIKRLSGEHPLILGFAVTITFILLLIFSVILGGMLPGEGYASIGGLLGRIVSIALLMAVMVKFGWLDSAG